MKNYNCIGFFGPQRINAENAQNIHLVVGVYDSQEELIEHRRTCCCGKCSVAPNAEWDLVASENTDEATRMKARAIAKDLEDCGFRVCGQCVATLYRDDV